MIDKIDLRYLCLIVFFLLLVGVRLDFENYLMDDQNVINLIDSASPYTTVIEVKSDPISSNFSVSFTGADRTIGHRTHVIGSTSTTSVLIGLKVGDKISVYGYLSELSKYQQYKSHEHIVGVFKVLGVSKITNSKSLIDLSTQALRNIVEKGCSRMAKDERGVCEGLLVGKRNSISKGLYDSYRQAQLTHLLVASGANIAFLVGFLNPLLSKVSKRFSSVAIIFIAIFYCAVTRFEPSMLRASVMVIIPSVLILNGYGISKIRVFVFTLIGCVIIDPFLIYRVGFWLSFCAAGGLFFVAPKLENIFKSEIIRNTLAATICVQPVLWMVFGFAVPVRWWASVIAVGVAEPLTTIGMFVVSLSAFLGPESIISQIAILPIEVGCKTINVVAKIGASQVGYWFGWAITVMVVFAYTYRGKKCKS